MQIRKQDSIKLLHSPSLIRFVRGEQNFDKALCIMCLIPQYTFVRCVSQVLFHIRRGFPRAEIGGVVYKSKLLFSAVSLDF